jgi:hypothetical protein
MFTGTGTMKNKVILLTGSITVLLGIGWVLLWPLFSIGINDSEVGNIKRSGQPSHPGKIIWEDWRNSGLEEIVPFNTNIDVRDADKKAFRFGVAKNWACSFKIYQINYRLPDGSTTDVYGYGPNWGATMNMSVPWAVVGMGTMITLFGEFGRAWRIKLGRTKKHEESNPR